jgi:hypothetical protein
VISDPYGSAAAAADYQTVMLMAIASQTNHIMPLFRTALLFFKSDRNNPHIRHTQIAISSIWCFLVPPT